MHTVKTTMYYLINTNDTIIVYMDMIPGNKDCITIYNRLKKVSKDNDFRVIIFPIVCAEFYMLKSIKNTQLFIDYKEVLQCINKQPHILSKLMDSTDKAKYCKNFEKYCKYLLKFGVKKHCIKPYNKITDENGEYYRNSCLCELATSECAMLNILDKSVQLLNQYRYVPSGSYAKNKRCMTDEEAWCVHKKLVENYNEFVENYRVADHKSSLNKYKNIICIK